MAFLVLLLGMLMVACGSAGGEATATMGEQDPATGLDGKALTEERCTKCHTLERVEAAKKTLEEWKANVERMVGNGAELNEAEQKVAIEYLSNTYPR